MILKYKTHFCLGEKIMTNKQKKDGKTQNYSCLLCGADTGIPLDTPIGPYPYETFPRWIEGAGGPICQPCDERVYGRAVVGG